MANEVTTQLENAPLPEIIKSLAVAIGEAQFALDLNSIEQIKLMADEKVTIKGEERSMLELGLVPSFYHFTESTIEAQVAFSLMESREISASASISAQIKIVTVAISASYTSKYSFEASGSSVISTKLVSVPAPAALAELVSRLTLDKKIAASG